MTEQIQRKLSDSKAARWTALIVVSFTMMCGYFITDCINPMQKLIINELGWSTSEYGFFTGSYGYFNVFLCMLVIGGLILDKKGVRFTGKMSCSLMVLGAAIKTFALSPLFTNTGMTFGIHNQVLVACLGFATFGVGCETAGITVSKIIVKWFTGHELALAMGLQVATARIGTALAMSVPLPIALHFHKMVCMPVLFGTLLLCVGLIAFVIYCGMDKRLDSSLGITRENSAEAGFQIKDLKLVLTNKGFWLIALLCVLFYSGVFPFLKFAATLMQDKYNVSPEYAGLIPSLLPFGTILLTPLFGNVYDRIGKGATLMIIGSVMMIAVHALFAAPILNVWWFAIIEIIVLGIAFSLVPSAMWPSVPKIIPQHLLGSAYALIFYVQNIGLALVPALIGWVLGKYGTTVTPQGVHYNYTYPMCVFTLFGILAVVVALLLKREDKKKGYGLEQPNIKK